MTPLQHLADQVSAAQDELLRELELAPQAREQLLQSLPKRPGHLRRWAWLSLPAAAAAMCLLHVWSRPLAYRVGASPVNAAVGSWLSAPANGELPLSFSDQSRVTLAAGSHARVTDLSQREVKILLENGHVSVGVRHQENRHWHLRAGPFDVAVTGTRFEVTWVPEREQFELSTLEGKVEVSGEQFAPRSVSAGETLRAERHDGRYQFVETNVPAAEPAQLVPSAAPLAASGSPAPVTADSSLRVANDTHAAHAAPSGSRDKHDAAEPRVLSWRELAAAGQYRAALDLAEKDGFEQLCNSSNLADLLALSEAARFAGHPERARLALTSLRERFRGATAASVATYTLGRIAFDNFKDYRAAAQWFRTYLSEQPGGALAREAAGRVIEASQRSGDHTGAQAAARSYLAHYPDGPQNQLARQVLAQ